MPPVILWLLVIAVYTAIFSFLNHMAGFALSSRIGRDQPHTSEPEPMKLIDKLYVFMTFVYVLLLGTVVFLLPGASAIPAIGKIVATIAVAWIFFYFLGVGVTEGTPPPPNDT